MKYNPRNQHHRKTLAGSLLHTLNQAGFTDETHKHNPCQEMVFSRTIPNSDVRVLVYTSIRVRVTRGSALRFTRGSALRFTHRSALPIACGSVLRFSLADPRVDPCPDSIHAILD